MICKICGGHVSWAGQFSTDTTTRCTACGAINAQAVGGACNCAEPKQGIYSCDREQWVCVNCDGVIEIKKAGKDRQMKNPVEASRAVLTDREKRVNDFDSLCDYMAKIMDERGLTAAEMSNIINSADEFDRLLMLQHKRSIEANEIYRKFNCLPENRFEDLGTLLEWFCKSQKLLADLHRAVRLDGDYWRDSVDESEIEKQVNWDDCSEGGL